MEAFVGTINQGFQEIVENCIPWAEPMANSKSYWNADCTKVTKAAKLGLKEHHRLRDEQSAAELREAEREKVRVIRKTRTLYWREGVHKASLRKDGIWKLARWGRERSMAPKALPQFPAILDQRGVRQTSFEGKVDALRSVLFPPTPAADLEDIPGTQYPTPVPIGDKISSDEVLKAITHPAADKAPGVSGIPNRFLRCVAPHILDSLTRLFQACFDLGHHPRFFKEANTVILKKPNKPDYSEPKAYRPIALLDTLGKALETVISKRLSRLAESYSLLPQQQMGARKGRSVETALESLTDAVHTVWNCSTANSKKVASLLSLDVAGAFDNVSHERLLHNLRERRVPEKIVKWTSSFLRDRATSVTLEGQTSEMRAVETGIPQGSPISPVLFLFFNAPLIERCARAALPIQTGGFVDDIHLLAYSGSTEDNCRVLHKAHDICLEWAKTHGATFAPKKYELVHLTRSPKRFNMEASLDFNEVKIDPSPSIRVLGLHVDTKLRWGPHIAQLTARAVGQKRALECLAGSTWGATFAKCRTVYSMVIRPMLTFAAPIWHHPRGIEGFSRKPSEKLTKIQNECLRRVTGAYKATPIPVLEAEASIAPLEYQLDKLVLQHQALRGTHPATKEGNERIARYFQGSRGRKRKRGPTPTVTKEAWALKALKEKSWDLAATSTRRKKNWVNPYRDVEEYQSIDVIGRKIQDWFRERRSKKWEKYQRRIPIATRTPAQAGNLYDGRFDHHKMLRKAESSVAVQMRSGKIGLNAFLNRIRVPGIDPDCRCGWRRQDVKHILLFCPRSREDKPRLLAEAGTRDFQTMLTTTKGIRVAARWMVNSGWLNSFELASEQLQRSRLPLGVEETIKPKKGARRSDRTRL